MNQVFNFLFDQYAGYQILEIVLEVIAVLFGLLSVWYAKKDNIWVYPTGMISTLIFVYLLLKWSLLGDMLINAYYFIMSIYGWYNWTRKVDATHFTPITKTSIAEYKIAAIIFSSSIIFVVFIYDFYDKFNTWTAYIDTLTTAVFFVGMWMMAKKKIENWIFWIIGDLISVPLYFFKGHSLTSIQYFIFLIIAYYGYQEWKKSLDKSPQIS
ncbi:MAG: nicotinamide riboside transporter PnuC [Flavobacteriaceae bacterium]|jgi:nicotinamide mononucleotide transporter|nr:nicotinamide riboside transporter PnuC [Flavobacteriaceae bacterium]